MTYPQKVSQPKTQKKTFQKKHSHFKVFLSFQLLRVIFWGKSLKKMSDAFYLDQLCSQMNFLIRLTKKNQNRRFCNYLLFTWQILPLLYLLSLWNYSKILPQCEGNFFQYII